MQVLLDEDDLKALSAGTRAEIISYFLKNFSEGERKSPPERQIDRQSDGDLADLDLQEALKFLVACSESTRAALKSIVKQGVEFKIGKVAKDLDKDPGGMRAIWSAITKRTRTIKGNNEARLISWFGEPEYDKSGNYIDQLAKISIKTQKSFERAFDIEDLI